MINEFKSLVGRRGLSKPTMFVVEVRALPNKMGSIPSIVQIQNDLRFFAETTEFAGTQILTQDLRHYDLHTKFAYHKAHDDLNVTFRIDRDYNVKKLFDTWVDTIYNPNTGNISYRDDYIGEIQISQVMENGDVPYSVIFEEVFPIQVQQVSLGWDQAGQYNRLPVTFAYSHMKIVAREALFKQTNSPTSSIDKVMNKPLVEKTNIDTLKTNQYNSYFNQLIDKTNVSKLYSSVPSGVSDTLIKSYLG